MFIISNFGKIKKVISRFTRKTLFEGLGIIKSILLVYKRDLVVLGFLGIISAVASGIVPYLVGRMFDTISSPGSNFVFFLVVWGIVTFMGHMVDWRGGIKREQLGIIIEADYVIDGFSRVLEMPVSFHKKHKIGNVTHRILRSAAWLNRIASRVIMEIAPQILSVFVALSVMFYFNVFLASVLSAGIIIYVLILIKFLPPLVKLQIKMLESYQKGYGDAYDAVLNAQAVKQAIAEKHEKKKLHKIFRLKAVSFLKQLIVFWQGLSFYQRFIILITQLTIFVYALFSIRNGSMTIGELVMFNIYGTMVFGPLLILGNNWQLIQNGLMSLIQSEKILSLSPENYAPQNAVILSDIKGDISFKNLEFYYQKRIKILEDITLRIRPGEIIALVGESGVGKSTLIDLISGYYFPRSGKVLIDGHDIRKINLKFLRSKIAVVPQEVILFNDTVRNNIRYGKFDAAEEEVQKAAKMAHADEFIEGFPKKYDQIVGERGIKLSAGQKQRIAIARAVLRDPRILILDEPTSSLDAKSEKYIQESLEKLMKGRTTIIIAHRLSTVRKADKIIVFDEGNIVEQGKHEELIKAEDGVYRRLYDLQFGLR